MMETASLLFLEGYMATIYEKFEMRGVHYVEIHFKVTPFAGDLIVHCFKDGVEISREAYGVAKTECRKLWMAADKDFC
jgi:hypothetical protein